MNSPTRPTLTRDPNAHPSRTDYYWHPEAGSVCIRPLASAPKDRPIFCAGTFHVSVEAAWSWFCTQWNESKANPAPCDDGRAYASGYAYACGYRD